MVIELLEIELAEYNIIVRYVSYYAKLGLTKDNENDRLTKRKTKRRTISGGVVGDGGVSED